MQQTEAKVRADLINPQLAAAGWDLSDHTKVRFEVPVNGYDPAPWHGFTDFSMILNLAFGLRQDRVADLRCHPVLVHLAVPVPFQ